MMLEESNVLFVTLDACRYDTTRFANTPFLASLGTFRQAATHGDYTLPAHMSFFMGYLPTVIGQPFEPYYNSEVKQLWRLASGRPRDPNTCGLLLKGDNVLDAYRRKGFRVIGAGGVRWFRHAALAGLFDRFYFYGLNDLDSVFHERLQCEFPLEHGDELIAAVSGGGRYFLFINCPETHVPYDAGTGELEPGAREVIGRAAPCWGFKPLAAGRHHATLDDYSLLHRAQVRALEVVDERLARFVGKLPRPLLIVITADHGECFGEDGFWGHGFPHTTVMNVPLLITSLL